MSRPPGGYRVDFPARVGVPGCVYKEIVPVDEPLYVNSLPFKRRGLRSDSRGVPVSIDPRIDPVHVALRTCRGVSEPWGHQVECYVTALPPVRVRTSSIVAEKRRTAIVDGPIYNCDVVELYEGRRPVYVARWMEVSLEVGPYGGIGPVGKVTVEPEPSSTIICTCRVRVCGEALDRNVTNHPFQGRLGGYAGHGGVPRANIQGFLCTGTAPLSIYHCNFDCKLVRCQVHVGHGTAGGGDAVAKVPAEVEGRRSTCDTCIENNILSDLGNWWGRCETYAHG